MTTPTDQLQRFYFAHSGIRGFWVSLSGVLDELASRREYPQPITGLLGEMLAAAAMVADGLKWPGSLALQAKMPGPLRTLMAEYRPPNGLRAIARSAQGDFTDADFNNLSHQALLNGGQLAVSLLPNEDQPQVQPYQGLVDLASGNLASNLESYFANSEQVPTLISLAADQSEQGHRAVGLLLQKLPNNADDPWDEDLEAIAWTAPNSRNDLEDLPELKGWFVREFGTEVSKVCQSAQPSASEDDSEAG
jgi:molecular chaperone Hsp33